MRDHVLIYEPDTVADVNAYREGLGCALPHLPVVATSDLAEALVAVNHATVLVAKAQDISVELIAAAPRLGWIQALTTGTDRLRALGVPPSVLVTSGRGIHGPQMGELALLLMMSLYRDFPRMLANQREARWQRWSQRLLLDKTAVIVGVGTISEAIAARCRPFGLKLIGITQRTEVAGFDELAPRARLREMAARADVLVVVVPYSPDTHHLVDAAVLAAMRPDAYLINIARGSVVDEVALTQALQQGRIAGAGLDVFAQEPLGATSPLWNLPNVIVTPHIGGMSDVYAQQILPLLLHNLRAWMADDHASMHNRVAFDMRKP
jgi:D-2-hydroxyacid dehydrogenase (NADP+)